jgi:quercetin dioxygenase-like cupin family protein
MPKDLGLGYADNGDKVAGVHVSSELAFIFNSE